MIKNPTYEELSRKVQDLERISEIYRSLAGKSTDLIHRTDQEGRITFVSDSVFTLSGYTVEEAIGMRIADEVYLFPEKRKAFLDLINKNGFVVNFEAQLKRKDGSTWWASTNAHAYKDPGNNISGIEGITRDISELKATEAALRAAEEKFRLSFHTSPDSINLNRVEDGIYIEINQGFTDLTGYTREDVIGRSSLEVNIWKNPEDRARLVEALTKTGEKNNLEAQFIKKTGEVGIGLMSARILNIGGEKVILSITRDITEKKAYEKQLLRFATAIEQANEDVLITDINGTIQYVNPSFEKNTGYTRTEVIGKKPSILKSGLHPLSFYESLWTTILDKKTWNGRISNRSRSGDIILYDVVITPILNEKQDITTFVSIRRDITEQNKIEQRLRQAQKIEAIGTLAGGIAHDFNNILSGIFGYAQLAKNKLDDPDTTGKNIDQIIKMAQNATDLVRQIMTFSRGASEKKLVIPIHTIVKEALTLLRASIPAMIEIKETITTKAMVMANPTNIHQIIMNLGTNAYHAMPETGGVLAIGLREVSFSEKDSLQELNIHPGKYLMIEVSDNGKGMDPEDIKKIFEPYFTTKEPGKGTGLGLSVVLGIVQDHDGDIKVYSEPGHGTTFHVYLPIVDKKADSAPDESIDDSPSISGSEVILLVDDEKTILRSTRVLLEELGYTVNSFSNGIEAFEAYQRAPNQFDIVITDMTMPGITGLELAHKIFNLRPDQKLIICTGYSELINKRHALSTGISAYYEKPVIIKKLAKTIRDVLDGPQKPESNP